MTEKTQPKISVYIAMSIDGYIARKDGSIDWLERGHVGDEDYGFKKFFNNIDALVLGRNTYETVSAFDKWPYTEKRVIVLSDTLKEVRMETELFCGPLTRLASMLHSDGIQHVWVDGGITISKFLEAGLVDHITISIIPVILGSGIPLFSFMNIEQVCRFISTQSFSSGLVQLQYEVIK
jgi:dihydrofolate reductase